jgi:hypothetical protein
MKLVVSPNFIFVKDNNDYCVWSGISGINCGNDVQSGSIYAPHRGDMLAVLGDRNTDISKIVEKALRCCTVSWMGTREFLKLNAGR